MPHLPTPIPEAARTTGARYSIAIAATAAAILIRWLLHPILGDSFPLVTLFGAVAAAAWFGGIGPAVLAVILGYAASLYLFVMPPPAPLQDLSRNLVALLAYLTTCAVIVGFGVNARKATHRSQDAEGALQANITNSEHAANSSRSVLETITDSFFTLDDQWRFLYVNPAAERQLDRSASDLLGKSIWTEFPELSGSEFERFYRETAAGMTPATLTSRYPANDCWYEVRAFPSREGLSVHSRDVSESKRAEAILRAGETRQREMSELLQKQAADLSDADRRKDEFLALLAHELRNPLAPMRNSLEFLKRTGNLTPDAESARSVLERQLTQMVRLVDDLLDVSRISRGTHELRRERIELSSVVTSATEASRPLLDANGIRLAIELPSEPVYLSADHTRLTQVFRNLLDNAAKFTDRGGVVTLSAAREDGMAVVVVKDNGVGISAGQLPRLFDMFSQVNTSAARSQGGLGIGLALVRRLVELHDGEVEARSDGPGLGSEFVVRLPTIGEETQSAAAPDSAGMTQPGPLKILIVDDNRDAATSLAAVLGSSGHDVRAVHDGYKALNVAATYLPDVVLLDVGMPGLNGHEVAERIRGNPWGEDMVLIAVTGWGHEQDKRRAREAGFDHHLEKPADPEELDRLLAGVAAKNRASKP